MADVKKQVPSMSKRVYKQLARGQKNIDAKKYQNAREELARIFDFRKLNDNELGQTHSMLGYIAFLEEDYATAIEEYESVISYSAGIPDGLVNTTRYTLAQLSFVVENYDAAFRHMQEWIAEAKSSGPEPYVFLGQVRYQQKNYKQAAHYMEVAEEIASAKETQPKENWLQLQNFLYFELEEWDKVLATLNRLHELYPSKVYLTRLAAIYMKLDRQADHDQTIERLERESSTYRVQYDKAFATGNAALQEERYEEAERSFAKAVEAARMLDAETQFASFRLRAHTIVQLGRYDIALRVYKSVFTQLEKSDSEEQLGETHGVTTETYADFASDLYDLGRRLILQERYADALMPLRRAVEYFKKAPNDQKEELTKANDLLIKALRATGNDVEAAAIHLTGLI